MRAGIRYVLAAIMSASLATGGRAEPAALHAAARVPLADHGLFRIFRGRDAGYVCAGVFCRPAAPGAVEPSIGDAPSRPHAAQAPHSAESRRPE